MYDKSIITQHMKKKSFNSRKAYYTELQKKVCILENADFYRSLKIVTKDMYHYLPIFAQHSVGNISGGGGAEKVCRPTPLFLNGIALTPIP